MPLRPHVLWGLGKSRSLSTNTQAPCTGGFLDITVLAQRSLPLDRIQFIRPGGRLCW